MRYRVYVREIHLSMMMIEAESEEDARKKVAEGDGTEVDIEFVRTLDNPAEFRVEAVRGV